MAALDQTYAFVEAWGMTTGAYGRVLRPRSVDDVRSCFEVARADGVSLGARGTGNSYGDASMNGTGHVLDVSRMNRFLDFDPETGVAEVESGATIAQLWRTILPHGYWPRVVSGTMFPTLAGTASMNIHGKNNFVVGTIGDAILEFDLMLPSGELRTCSREQNAELFHAAIGGFGMLGVFTRIKIRTKRVYSGDLEVRAFANRDLGEMMAYMEEHRDVADYLVGWVDCFAREDALGRGQVHDARYLEDGVDPHPEQTLTVAHNTLPGAILGFPKSELWRVMRPLNNDFGMRFINTVKYWLGRVEAMGKHARWSHAQFAFLLDFVPNWKWAYGRKPGHGLIQYQTFLPKEAALEVNRAILRENHRAGFVPYLGVYKRHRPDPFLLTHAVDGWSFAMDFKVTPGSRERLWQHCHRLSDMVLEAGGRFYFAKDLVLRPQDVARMYPAENLERFFALKRELDPDGLLQTDLWRRVFAPLLEQDGTSRASA